MSHIGRFGLAVVLIMGAACGGGPSANGKALLLGQTDHSGTRISLMKGSNVAGQTTTDSSGAYRIRGPDGAYDLRFEHDGYQPVVQADVVVKGNDRSVPDVTLRRGALIDPAPVQSLRLLGNSKALVQFDHGIGSPSYVVDLVSGSRVRIASGGAVSVRDANNQFATVSIDHLYRLDLTTGALDPVQPDEARSGVAAAGAYFYVGTDGNFNVLPTGALQASSLDFPFCQPFGFSTTGELKGQLATVGRSRAVAALPGNVKLSGTVAWLIYIGIHLVYLAGFRNRVSAFAS